MAKRLPRDLPVTDQEIAERLSQFEANSDDWRHVLNAAGIPEDDPKFGIKLSLEQRALADLASTRQQLTALRDELISDSENKMSMGGEGIARTAEQGFHRGVSIGMTCAAGRINSILKGAP